MSGILERRPRYERASDAEREAVVERLREHAIDGRLDADELAARAEAAYSARTHGELADLLVDLPRAPSRPRGRRRGLTWRHPVLATLGGATTTVVVAHVDGGFRGPLDGVAAVPFWATLASGGVLAVTLAARRLSAPRPRHSAS
jgi:hypothetical protein